jgi:hypothetical protein
MHVPFDFSWPLGVKLVIPCFVTLHMLVRLSVLAMTPGSLAEVLIALPAVNILAVLFFVRRFPVKGTLILS